jgi:hypothetical protein
LPNEIQTINQGRINPVGRRIKTLPHRDRSSASELVEVFSDTVLQKVYEKLEYLEHRSAQTCMVFRCMSDSTELIVLQRKPDTSVDLSNPDSIHDALVKQLDSITFYTSSRKNTKERELEIHQLIEQGCVLSSGEFWQQLKVYTSSQQ